MTPDGRTGDAAPGHYDRSGRFQCRLPAPPPPVRSRSDAARDYERLKAAFRSLLDAHDSEHGAAISGGGGGGGGGGCGPAPSPSATYDSFDEAIAAANAVSVTLCEWKADVEAAAPAPAPAAGS